MHQFCWDFFFCKMKSCKWIWSVCLQNHVNLVHRKGRTKVCPHPGCGKKFYLSNHLHRHMIIHSGKCTYTPSAHGCIHVAQSLGWFGLLETIHEMSGGDFVFSWNVSVSAAKIQAQFLHVICIHHSTIYPHIHLIYIKHTLIYAGETILKKAFSRPVKSCGGRKKWN